MGPRLGVGYRRGVPISHAKRGSSENIPIFESQRMALVITLQHKYIQLSGSDRTLPTCSRIGVVMLLGLELCPSIIIARCTYVSI